MKKISIFVILCVFILYVSGCGKTSGLSEINTTGEEKVGETTILESDRAVDVYDKSAGDEASLLDVYIKSNYEKSCPEEIAYFTAVVTTSYPKITLGHEDAKKYPKLQDALTEYSRKWEKVLQDYKAYLYERAVEEVFNRGFSSFTNDDYDKFTQAELHPIEYNSETSALIMRADSKIFSARTTDYTFIPNEIVKTQYYGTNFDPKTGESLSIYDVIRDPEPIKDILREELAEILMDQIDDGQDYAGSYMGDMELEDLPFTISYDRLYFYLNNVLEDDGYFVDIIFSDLEGNIKPEYITQEERFMLPFTGEMATHFFDGGKEIYVDFYEDLYQDEEIFRYNGYTLSCNGSQVKVEGGYDNVVPFLIKLKPDEYYVYMERRLDDYLKKDKDNYAWADIFYIGDGSKLVYLGEHFMCLGGSFFGEELYESVTQDPFRLKLYNPTANFGTFDGYRYYHLDKNGIEPETEYYFFDQNDPRQVYTSLIDFYSDIIDENGDILEEDALIPAGTEFRSYRGSEDVLFMDFILSDGRIASVITERGPHHEDLLNLVDAEELFGEEIYSYSDKE